MPSYNDARLRQANDRPIDPSKPFVLYWMQAYRRLTHNHALNRALALAVELKKPLVVYEGLKLNYPWASARMHTFILQGMRDNAAVAKKLGVDYWPFVETPDQPGRRLLLELSKNSCAIVTDDFPGFIHPGQTAAVAKRVDVAVLAVDGNSIVPLSLLGSPVSAAVHLRRRIQNNFAEAWRHQTTQPVFPKATRVHIDPPFQLWNADQDISSFVRGLPIDQTVPPVAGFDGGAKAGKKRLASFVANRLAGYAEKRSEPASAADGYASGLSPYLHFGHISIEEVVAATLNAHGPWDVKELDGKKTGSRQGYYSDDADVNSFLDEAITWRDVGYHWHVTRHADTAKLATALPAWALATLNKHASDPRTHLYSSDQWEAGETHDELWNAAQRELVAEGRIHNYLRMLWGKKVLEWSSSPENAYRTLVHLNNKYALDGRDPNSYSGILWCFGLFDRPWPPERNVSGTVRYMSSDNTRRKFRLESYLRYVSELPTIAQVRMGQHS